MGKWTDMDSDSQRLPSGFERIGYDADDQTYTFRGPDGRIYESEPGNRYGELRLAGQPRPPRTDRETAEQIDEDIKESTRMMLPFALLVFVFLVLVFKLVNRGRADTGGLQALDCAEGSHQVQICKGDTCWAIGEEYRVGVEELLKLAGNEGVDCERLTVGQRICVPE